MRTSLAAHGPAWESYSFPMQALSCVPFRSTPLFSVSLFPVLVKEIQHGPWDPGQPGEVGNGLGVRIHTAQAAETSPHRADAGLATVEAGGTAAEATEQLEMTDLSVIRQHRMPLARIRTEPGATGSGTETGGPLY